MDQQTHDAISHTLHQLVDDSSARGAYVVNDYEEVLVFVGEKNSMHRLSLTANGAGEQLPQLLGEIEFAVVSHYGDQMNLHVSRVGNGRILVIGFDERSSLGLVRMCVKKHRASLEKLFGDEDSDSGSKGGRSDEGGPESGSPAGPPASRW